jgi:3-oxoacyl-[acyl-carrier protein] reductase
MSFDAWREIMSISLDGSFHCIKACLPSMIANKGGSIITLGGDGALSGLIGKVHGSAAKNGLAGMTRALALELAAYDIRVNCVSPGSIDTTRAAHRPQRRGAAERIPLGRHGKAEEIAATVRFLCGPGAGFITGQTVHVNGGEKMFF